MDERDRKQIEEWDPDEAKEKLSGKGLKMPVTFKRDRDEVPEMEMEVEEPKEKVIVATKPKIIHKSKNKNALF